jgi:ABC-2 type transport system permease protein
VADLLTRPPSGAGVDGGRSVSTSRVVAAQVGHANRAFRRTPAIAVVTLGFPLAFLLLLGLAAREAAPDEVTGADIIQLTAPTAAVFAAVMAAYVMLPFLIAQARERGVLKRLHGTPLPTWAYVTGQVVSAVVVAAAGTALMLTVAVVAFGLQFPLRGVPALLVTFLLGVGCAAALGVAVAALVRGAEAVMTVTTGSFLLLAFTSGMFGVGAEPPRVLDVVTWWFPLRHFSAAFGDLFLPDAVGASFGWAHLGVLALWTLAGVSVAVWGFRRAPQADRGRTGRSSRSATALVEPRVGDGRSPRSATLVWAQVRHANRAIWRQPSSAFFSVAFPVLFTIVVPYAFGNPVIEGIPLSWLVTPAMAVFGVVVTAFVNVPENLAIAREQRILERLRGTPLPASAYLLGRLGSIAWVGTVTVIGVFVAGWAVHGVTVDAGAVLPLIVVFAVGIAAFAALGLAVVALVRDAGSVSAVALGIFLPLGFISDLLAFGMEMPPVLATIGWIFPLKHLTHAVDAAFSSGALAFGHLAVIVLWGLVGAAVALRRFRWAPR